MTFWWARKLREKEHREEPGGYAHPVWAAVEVEVLVVVSLVLVGRGTGQVILSMGPFS